MIKERACANNFGMSRRKFFCALPATCMPLASSATTDPKAIDPLTTLYQEWLLSRREWQALSELPNNGDWDDPRSRAAEAREMHLESQMLKLRPTTLEGVGTLAALAWAYINPGVRDPEEYRRLALGHECRPIVAIWNACTGKDGYPEI